MTRFIHPLRHGEDGDPDRLVNIHAFTDIAVVAGVGGFKVEGYLPSTAVAPGATNAVTIGSGYETIEAARHAMGLVRRLADRPRT